MYLITSIVNLALPENDPNRIIEIIGYQAESYSESLSEPSFEPLNSFGRSSPYQIYTGGGSRSISFSMKFHRDMISPYTSTVYHGHPGGLDGGNDQYLGLYLGKEDDIDWDNYATYKQLILKKYLNDMREGQYRGPQPYADIYDGVFSNSQEILQRWWNESNDNAEKEATLRFNLFLAKLRALNYPVYASNGIIQPSVYVKIGNTLRLKGNCKVNITYDGLVKFNSFISCTADFTFTEVVDQAWSATEVIGGMQRYVKWMDSAVPENNRSSNSNYDGRGFFVS